MTTLLPVRRGGPLQAGVSVKLQPASAEGGRQPVATTLNPPGNKSVCDVNVKINVQGLLDGSHVQFLLDSDYAGLVGGGTGVIEPVKKCLPKPGGYTEPGLFKSSSIAGTINISPEPVKIYQGTRQGLFTPGMPYSLFQKNP